jgi:hypothetical protein
MTEKERLPTGAGDALDYRSLPPIVPLDDTIATVETVPAPDPAAGRNVDQHRALRDD